MGGGGRENCLNGLTCPFKKVWVDDEEVNLHTLKQNVSNNLYEGGLVLKNNLYLTNMYLLEPLKLLCLKGKLKYC